MIQKGGLWSPRENIGSLRQKFNGSHIDEKYHPRRIEGKIRRVGQVDAATGCRAKIGQLLMTHERAVSFLLLTVSPQQP
jgi:hypothetical protein